MDLDIRYTNKKLWNERQLRSAKFIDGALRLVAGEMLTRIKGHGVSASGAPFRPYPSKQARKIETATEMLEFLSKKKGWSWVERVYDRDGDLHAQGGGRSAKLPTFWQGIMWIPRGFEQPSGHIAEIKSGAKGYASRGDYERLRGKSPRKKTFTATGGMWGGLKVVMAAPNHGKIYFGGSSRSWNGRKVNNRIKARACALNERKNVIAVSGREMRRLQLYINQYLDAYVFRDIKESTDRLKQAKLQTKLTRSLAKLAIIQAQIKAEAVT